MKFSSRNTKIAKDWAAVMPGFEFVSYKHIVRLHGPVILGICLDAVRDPKFYQPIAYSHALVAEWPVLTLSLSAPLRAGKGGAKEIRVSLHDQELESNCSNLMQQYPIINQLNFSFSDYVGLAAKVVSGTLKSNRGYYPHIYRDIILVAASLGQTEFAREQLEIFSADLCGRSDYNMRLIGSISQWVTDIEKSIPHVSKIIESEKKNHHLTSFKDHGMSFDSPASLLELL